MTAMGMFSMYTMSHQASAGSMDASASHTRCTSACAAFRAIINVLDAIILASIFVVISVSLNGLSNSLVLAVLVQLAVLLVLRHRIAPKR